MKIIIEKAKKSDYEDIIKVFSEVSELHAINLSWKFKSSDPKVIFSEEYFNELLNDSNVIFFVAKNNSEIIWFLRWTRKKIINHDLLQDRDFLMIDDLGVKNDYHKKGIGSLLMKEVESWSKTKNVSEIELNVWSFNENAIQFYLNKSFQAINQRMRKTL